jgi:hypothetical protein
VGELYLAVQALRAAYSGIQYCCEALSEGTVQVQKIKKAAENAQQIVKDAKSIWQIIKGLFGGKTLLPAAPAAPTATPAAPTSGKTKKQEYTTHIPTEDEIVQQFLGHVGQFFKTHKLIVNECEHLLEAEYAKDEPDPDVILRLSAYKAETDRSYSKLSSMMRGAHVPTQLGPLWDNFNAIYGQVQDAQRDRKERERIKRINDRWLQRQTRDFLIDRAMAVVLTLGALALTWGVMLSLRWLVMTLRGFA